MSDEFDPLTEALRDSLARHAAEAPRGDFLAERIINTAQQGPQTDPRRPRHGWRTWALPLVAAGAVGAVVAAIVGIQDFRTTASQEPGTSVPTIQHTQSPTQVQSTTPSEPPTTASTPPPGTLTNFAITDLTFVGPNDGWALGSADCVRGPGRCTALWRTTDGRTWTSMAGAAFNVPGVSAGCTDKCVHNIRFANDQIGYAFGPSAFFMTTDGGASWQQQPGGALQLETLDNNVIRVTGTPSGCPGPCIDGVETSAVGSSDWTPSGFRPDSSSVENVLLARGNGGDAYLLLTRNPAGGAQNETSTLYRSTDKGTTWRDAGEPCATRHQEIDSRAIAGGGDSRVTVLCVTRQAPQHYDVASSADAGANFGMKPGVIPPAIAPTLLTGDPATVLVAAGDGMVRSTDGGATWQSIADVTGPISWVGFETEQVGRAVSADGTTIWTTRDGGATWHAASIG